MTSMCNVRRAASLLLAGGWILAGCNPVSVRDGNEAEIRVGTQGDAQVTVLTSTLFFLEEGSTAVDLIESDTVTAPAPVEGTFDLRETRRFYVEVLASEPEDVPVRLQVWIDGSEAADSAGSLADGTLRFIFQSRSVR
jgi:hypothetical protein